MRYFVKIQAMLLFSIQYVDVSCQSFEKEQQTASEKKLSQTDEGSGITLFGLP